MAAPRPPADPIYFESPAGLRDWLDANAATATELWLGYYRKASGRPSLTWSEAVDEALCVGWIDGVRYSVDAERFTQRFTPRRKGSNWSTVNIAKIQALTKQGRMRPAGIAAFEARTEDRSGVYSYEQRHLAKLEPDEDARFREATAAWTWFETQAPSFRTGAVWWVTSAKRRETRAKRLATLIEDAAAGRRPKALTPPGDRR